MYEVKRKREIEIDWNEEITVNIALKELAVMYSIMRDTSTSDAQRAVQKGVNHIVDIYEGDIAYKIYNDAQLVLTNNGVKVFE